MCKVHLIGLIIAFYVRKRIIFVRVSKIKRSNEYEIHATTMADNDKEHGLISGFNRIFQFSSE